jgi:hypothetical protein
MKFCRDRRGNSNVRIITTFRNISVLEIACYILNVTSASFVLLLKVLRAWSFESYSRLSGQYWWPFMTPESSSPYVEEPTTGPFFEPDVVTYLLKSVAI